MWDMSVGLSYTTNPTSFIKVPSTVHSSEMEMAVCWCENFSWNGNSQRKNFDTVYGGRQVLSRQSIHLQTSTHLLYLIEWTKEVSHPGKVNMIDVIVAVQWDDAWHCILVVQHSKGCSKNLLGDSPIAKASQLQLTQEEVMKIALPELKVQPHCLHCQYQTVFWGSLRERFVLGEWESVWGGGSGGSGWRRWEKL